MAAQVTRSGTAHMGLGTHAMLSVCGFHEHSKVAGMAYDVARVRGLHPSLGDGWVHLDAQRGMLLPDSVATTVSTAFRNSMTTTVGPHPSAQRSAAVLEAAREAVADLVNAGDGLPQKSDVKYHGVLVGMVNGVVPASNGKPNYVHIDLKPEFAESIRPLDWRPVPQPQ